MAYWFNWSFSSQGVILCFSLPGSDLGDYFRNINTPCKEAVYFCFKTLENLSRGDDIRPSCEHDPKDWRNAYRSFSCTWWTTSGEYQVGEEIGKSFNFQFFATQCGFKRHGIDQYPNVHLQLRRVPPKRWSIGSILAFGQDHLPSLIHLTTYQPTAGRGGSIEKSPNFSG